MEATRTTTHARTRRLVTRLALLAIAAILAAGIVTSATQAHSAVDSGSHGDDPAATDFLVIVKHRELFRIWPATEPLPAGWKPTGIRGSLDDCAAFIAGVNAATQGPRPR